MLAQREQIKGAFLWSLLQVFSERVVQAILFFVIAKLLGPEDLGVASIAVTISAIATYIMQGVVQYVVQIRDDSERHLSALFAIAIAVSLCMSASAAVGGHLLARALDAEQLIGLSYVCALSPLAAALGAIPEGLLIRRFEFRILALRKPIGVTLAGICCVLLALAGYGAWSVVIQSVFTTFITSFICVIGSKWRPSARFTLSDSLKCASGSLKLMLNLAADVLSHRAPELIIGIAIGASAVGYFRVAKSLYDLVISISLFPLSSVLLPIYSRGSEEGSAKKVLNTAGVAAALMGFALIAIVSLSDPLIGFFLGSDWAQTSQVFTILAFGFPAQALVTTFIPFLIAQGRSTILLTIAALQMFVASIIVLLGSLVSLIGASAGFTFSCFFYAFLITYFGLTKVERLRLREIREFCAVCCLLLFCALITFSLRYLSYHASFSVSIGTCAISFIFYVLALCAFCRNTSRNIMAMVKTYL